MKSKAFTLIELLVVISIIGVLSSVIFVSFSGQRDKAKLAKAQQFDAQISHALGAYAVGIWRFESISGGKVSDESGYGNDGTIHGNPILVDSEIYAGAKALKFDGSGDYVSLGVNSKNDGVFGDEDFSASLWFFVHSHGSTGNPCGDDRALIIGRENHGGDYFALGSQNNGRILLFNYGLSKSVSLDKWYHAGIVRDKSDGTIKLYINSVLVGAKNASTNNYNEAIKLGGGYSFGCGQSTYFNGAIDDVRRYNEALSSAQIQQHFVAGAPSHGIAVK